MTLEQTLQQIRKNKFWRDKTIISLLLTSLGLNVFIWLYLLFTLRGIKWVIPIHYDILRGIDQIGPWIKLLRIPLIGIIIFIINFILIYKFYLKEDSFFVKFLLISTAICQVILLIAAILIVNL